MRYSIEGQELTDIADALRARYGDTEWIMAEGKYPTSAINKTSNATGFDEMTGTSYYDPEGCYVTTIVGAKKIKVKIAYTLYYSSVAQGWCDLIKIVDGIYHNKNDMPSGGVEYSPWSLKKSIPLTVSELIFNNTDSVTIYWKPGFDTKNTGYYAEITGLDENGNELNEIREGLVEVPRVYATDEMAAAIRNLPAPLPDEAFLITGNCYYKFASGGWDWFINLYGNQITTKDLGKCGYMFSNYQLTDIPFVLNMAQDSLICENCFSNCSKLIELPRIKLNLINPSYSNINIESILNGCMKIKDAESLFDANELDALSNIKITSTYSCPRYHGVFTSCYSLRRIPSWWYKLKFSEESTATPYYSYWPVYNAFKDCRVLDEVNNIPIAIESATVTSNTFSSTFVNCARLKRITFEKNDDGTPKIVKWKTQTIDLCSSSTSIVGLAGYPHYITDYSGITADKLVTDDASYQALKDDPDWFTTKLEYCRYNHDSAVETINSLPDTSAYLASAGGTNTIKFKKKAGSLTDGGAIETLTAEEIAVATAKGWTVTLVN
jgi:hypothetical protein